MTIEATVEIIQTAAQLPSPIIIAIDGYGGSGKTTIATKLQYLLREAYVISIDDFIVKEKILEPSWDKGAFDRKRLEEQVLKPARSHQTIRYQRLIWDKNILSGFIEVPTMKYLIVEGISMLHPDIVGYYDFKIWIDTPIEIAKQRGSARDGSNENAQHWDLWTKNDARYQEKYHPERAADILIENN